MQPSEYKYIRAWGACSQQHAGATVQALENAAKDNAPANAVFYASALGRWATTADLRGETVAQMDKWLARQDAIPRPMGRVP